MEKSCKECRNRFEIEVPM